MRVGLPLSLNWLTLVRYFTRKSLMLRISVMAFCESSVVFHLNTSSLIIWQRDVRPHSRLISEMGCFKSRLVFVSLMKVSYLLLNNTFMKLIKVNLFNILDSFWPGEMEDAISPLSILLAWYKTFCNDLWNSSEICTCFQFWKDPLSISFFISLYTLKIISLTWLFNIFALPSLKLLGGIFPKNSL